MKGTIFEVDDPKYTQLDMDIKDAEIAKLKSRIMCLEQQLLNEVIARKQMANSFWGSLNTYYDDIENIKKISC